MVLAMLLGIIAALPATSTIDTTPLTIPDVVWNPLVAVLQLDRYLPVHELLAVAAAALAIQAGMAAAWLTGWLAKHLLGAT